MKATCLLIVLVLARALVLATGLVPLSAWTLPAFLWQDVAERSHPAARRFGSPLVLRNRKRTSDAHTSTKSRAS